MAVARRWDNRSDYRPTAARVLYWIRLELRLLRVEAGVRAARLALVLYLLAVRFRHRGGGRLQVVLVDCRSYHHVRYLLRLIGVGFCVGIGGESDHRQSAHPLDGDD